MKPTTSTGSLRVAAEIWLWRHGGVWPVAGALAVTASALSLGFARSEQERLGETVSQLAQARAAVLARKAASQPQQAPASDVQTVIAAGPPVDQLVAQMVQLARAEGIQLPQAEYQQHAAADASVVQVQITQPVRATYPQLRRYVEAVLRSQPQASLDQLGARRENVGQPQLDAKLRWSVWLPRAGASKPASATPDRSTP